jgi:hypothetical protein
MELKPKIIVTIDKATGEVKGEGFNYADGTCAANLGFLQGLGDGNTENKSEYYNPVEEQVEVSGGI